MSTTDRSTRVVRFGIHGATDLPASILRAGGRDERDVCWLRYDISDPFDGLRSGETDVMIVKFTVREPDLAVSRPVAYDPRVVVVGAGHPLADRESVSIEELADYDAFHCPGRFPAYVWDQVVPPRTPAGRVIHRVHRTTEVPDLVDRLRTTSAMHITVQALADVVPPGIRVVPVHDLPPAPVALCWLRHVEPPAHVANLIADIEAGSRYSDDITS